VFGTPVHRSHNCGKDIQACGVPKGIIGSIRFTQITLSQGLSIAQVSMMR